MSKAKRNWDRRLRKIRKHAKAIGLPETLLDLTALSDAETKTFLFDPEMLRKVQDFAALYGVTLHKSRR